jgi:hypothetical protein
MADVTAMVEWLLRGFGSLSIALPAAAIEKDPPGSGFCISHLAMQFELKLQS